MNLECGHHITNSMIYLLASRPSDFRDVLSLQILGKNMTEKNHEHPSLRSEVTEVVYHSDSDVADKTSTLCAHPRLKGLQIQQDVVSTQNFD